MAEVDGAGLDMFGGDTDSDSSEATPGSLEVTAPLGAGAAGFLELVEGTATKPEAGGGGGGGRGGGGATAAGVEGKVQEVEDIAKVRELLDAGIDVQQKVMCHVSVCIGDSTDAHE